MLLNVEYKIQGQVWCLSRGVFTVVGVVYMSLCLCAYLICIQVYIYTCIIACNVCCDFV